MRLCVNLRGHVARRRPSRTLQAVRMAAFSADASTTEGFHRDNRPRHFAFAIRSSQRQRQFAVASVSRSKPTTATHSNIDDKAFSSTDAMAVKAYNDAMVALDREYMELLPPHRPGNKLLRVSYHESYRQWLVRVTDQHLHPHKYTAIVAASRHVLQQFNSVKDFIQVMPRSTPCFTHAIAAAMFLQDYDRVLRYASFYKRSSKYPSVTDPTVVRMATNALLLQDKPTEAWRFVLMHSGAVLDDTVRTREKALAASTIACVLEYMKVHGQIDRIREFLAALDAQHRLDAGLSDYSRKLLLHAMVNDTNNTSDDLVWDLVEQYHRVFPVRINVLRFEMFIEMCIASGRWGLVARVLQQRDTEHIPKVFQRLAVQISRHAQAPSPRTMQLEIIAHLPEMTAIGTFATDEKAEFCGNVRRARELLGSGGHDQYR